MKKTVVLIFILIAIKSYAQEPVYFNNIYNPENTYASGRGILQIDNNYFGIFGTYEYSNYWYKLAVFKLSPSGNLIDWNLIGEDNHDYFAGSVGGTLIRTNDGNLAFACQVEDPSTVYSSLIKVNLNLDTIWKKDYYTENDWTMTIKVKQTDDEGFILVGQVDPGVGYYYDVLLLKTDSAGNEQWHQTYGTNLSEYGTDVIETPDGGYLIGGFKRNAAVYHTLDAMVIKTDSLGNEEWTKYYGNPWVDDDMALVTMDDDGNYLVVTVYGDSIMSNMYREGRVWIIKIDTNGNIIEDHKFGPSTISNHIKNIRKLENGYYVCSGLKFSYNYDYFKGWIFKFSENLDSIWMRDYYYYNGFEDVNFFYDASPTSDNGYIAIGKARPNQGGSNNKMWILKVDSMGCDTPGCNTGVNVNQLFSRDIGKLIVYPNPMKDILNIEYKLTPAFINISAVKNADLRSEIIVYDIFGRNVKKIEVAEGTETMMIDVTGLKKGMYFLKLKINNWQSVASKFLKN